MDGMGCWFSNLRPLVARSHMQKRMWLNVLSRIWHHFWCKLLPFEYYIWAVSSLNPESLMNERSVIATVLQRQLNFSLFVVYSLIAPVRVMICTLSLTFFPLLPVLFPHLIIFPSKAGRESEWNFLPQNQCLEKICCVFIKTWRWIIRLSTFRTLFLHQLDRKWQRD